jgi:hypothetical protein
MRQIACAIAGERGVSRQAVADNLIFWDVAVAIHRDFGCTCLPVKPRFYRAWKPTTGTDAARWLRHDDREIVDLQNSNFTAALQATLTRENSIHMGNGVANAEFEFPGHATTNEIHVIVIYPHQGAVKKLVCGGELVQLTIILLRRSAGVDLSKTQLEA